MATVQEKDYEGALFLDVTAIELIHVQVFELRSRRFSSSPGTTMALRDPSSSGMCAHST